MRAKYFKEKLLITCISYHNNQYFVYLLTNAILSLKFIGDIGKCYV